MGTARFLSAALLLTTGCAALPDGAPGSSLIGAWVIEDVSGVAVVGPIPLTVEFDETHRVSGSAGCNRYTGAYSWDAASGALTMTPLGVTRRACVDTAAMTQEQRLIDALQRATRTEARDDGAMTLVGEGARVSIRRRTGGSRPTAAAAVAAPSAQIATTSPAPQSPASGAPLRSAPPSSASYPLSGGAAAAPAPMATPAATATLAPPALSASAGARQASSRILVSGQIVLPAAAVLPADAVVRVQVRDVSRVGAPATVIGQQDLPAGSHSPFAFSVSAPTSVIGPNARLTLFAQILSGERLLYITDASNSVPLAGASGVNVPVVAAARAPSPAAVRPAPTAPVAPTALPTPSPLPALTEIPGSTPWRCRGETFRIAFEDNVALLTTADGAVARLARIDASDDPGAPRMFSNSILTVIRENAAGGVRFARGRAALTTCAPG